MPKKTPKPTARNYNVTVTAPGMEVPEFVFTIALPIGGDAMQNFGTQWPSSGQLADFYERQYPGMVIVVQGRGVPIDSSAGVTKPGHESYPISEMRVWMHITTGWKWFERYLTWDGYVVLGRVGTREQTRVKREELAAPYWIRTASRAVGEYADQRIRAASFNVATRHSQTP